MHLSTLFIALTACIAFCMTSLISTYIASDYGERLKVRWASMWCDPNAVPYDENVPKCYDRVIGNSEEMISLLSSFLCMATAVWAAYEIWQARQGNFNLIYI